MHQISTKFDSLMRPGWSHYYDDVTIPRWWTTAILNFKKLL